jgi:hypothetical protein
VPLWKIEEDLSSRPTVCFGAFSESDSLTYMKGIRHVDGFNLLSDICAQDNGLRFAATRDYVEQVKLGVRSGSGSCTAWA